MRETQRERERRRESWLPYTDITFCTAALNSTQVFRSLYDSSAPSFLHLPHPHPPPRLLSLSLTPAFVDPPPWHSAPPPFSPPLSPSIHLPLIFSLMWWCRVIWGSRLRGKGRGWEWLSRGEKIKRKKKKGAAAGERLLRWLGIPPPTLWYLFQLTFHFHLWEASEVRDMGRFLFLRKKTPHWIKGWVKKNLILVWKSLAMAKVVSEAWQKTSMT